MRLSEIAPAPGSRHTHKRVGRGHGSGRVKTSGRGQKGQKARTGSAIPAYFEGGQNRFSQRMPYLGGFKNPFRKEYIIINLYQLAGFESGAQVNGETLAAKGLIRSDDAKRLLKILGEGEVNQPVHVTANKVSESARKAIEAAGGTVNLIPEKTTVKTKRNREQPAPAPAGAGNKAR